MKEYVWHRAAHLAVSGPAGWVPVERLDVVRAAGAARVTIETWPVDEADLDQLVEQHSQSFAETVQGWRDHGVEAHAVLGRAGRRRRCAWAEPDGAAVTATIDYQLHDAAAYVVVTAVRNDDGDVAAEAEQVAASVAQTRTLGDVDEPAATPAVTRDPPVWDELTRAWAADPGLAGASTPPVRITFEEAIATASQHGASAFPGVDGQFLASLGAPGAQVAVQIARRSLACRFGADPEPARRLSVAVGHDLLVVREYGNDDGVTSTWCALRPDAAVLIEPDPVEGTVAVHALAPEQLLAVLLRDVPAGPVGEQAGRLRVPRSLMPALLRGDLDQADHPDLAPLGQAPAAVVRVRTVYRTGAQISGGEREWLAAGSAGTWLINSDPDPADRAELVLQPVSRVDLQAALLGLLPGPAPFEQEPGRTR